MSTLMYEQNIVLLGAFDPNNFGESFFRKYRLIPKGDVLNFQGVEMGARVESTEWVLNIYSNQVIVASKKPGNSASLLKKLTVAILKTISDKIRATGFNFNFYFFIEGDLHEESKLKFYSHELFGAEFDDPSAVYGFSAAKQFKYSNLSVDVRPQKLFNTETKTTANAFSINLNFHIENGLPNSSILGMIEEDYALFNSEADRIVTSYKEKWNS